MVTTVTVTESKLVLLERRASAQLHDDLSRDVPAADGGAHPAGHPLDHQCDGRVFHLYLQRDDRCDDDRERIQHQILGGFRLLQLVAVAFDLCLWLTAGLILPAAASGHRACEATGCLLRQFAGHHPRHRLDAYQPDAVDQSARYGTGRTAAALPAPRRYWSPRTATTCMNCCPTTPTGLAST